MILSPQLISDVAWSVMQAPQMVLTAASATASALPSATPSLPVVVPATATPASTATSTTTAAAVNFPTILFSLLIWGAVLFAAVVVLMPDRTREQRARIKALGIAGASTALFFALWAVETQAANAAIGTGGRPGGELVEQRRWLASFPISASYHLDADGLSLGLILLTAVVFFCVAIAVWRNDRRVKLLTIALLTLETAFLGVLCSYDWVLFLIFWTLPIAPVYLLIRGFGGGDRSRAAARYAITTLISAALLTVAALLIGFEDGTRSFDMGLAPLSLPATVGHLVFWLCTGAFLLSMAVVPLHVPLLDLEEDSSGALGAVFAALLPTLGAYGLLHVSVGFFPTISGDYSLLFAVLAVVSVVWAGIAAVRADDLRRLVGYVGTVQMGAVLLAVAGHTTLAITGAIFLLVSRGLTVSVLMLLTSVIQERTRRVRISHIAGLAWQAPRLAGFWLLGAFSAVGTPILSGFVAYLLLFTGSFPAHRWLTVVVLGGVLLTPLALLWAAQRMFLGGARETFSKVRDLGPFELTYLGVLVALIVFLGILPEHFADLFANGASSILFPGTSG